MTSTLASSARGRRRSHEPLRVRRFFLENGLSLALFGLFAVFLFGQIATGFVAHNDELVEHGQQAMRIGRYLMSGHFLEALFENWESEFLQMAAFVLLTIKLRQKGSSESKSFDEAEEVDEDPRKHRRARNVPWPVKRGGVVLKLYEHSLSLALVALFLFSFVMHAVGGLSSVNEEHLLHGEARETLFEYVRSAQFWFESFQNWQSEFAAVGALVVLSIFLRERGSPQSKPVAAPHSETGE
jgi:hypothetical protein